MKTYTIIQEFSDGSKIIAKVEVEAQADAMALTRGWQLASQPISTRTRLLDSDNFEIVAYK